MTETERILKSGIISPDFLKPEFICDYQVTEQSKKIWAISLEMLIHLDKVCKKHNLRYFLIFGTLLGAICHKGFIPWDDDVDVAMPRNDYEKLLTMPEEFAHPLFLQTIQTDPNAALSYARIRNTNTTAISRLFKYQKMNHGIFLDIFPLDKYKENEGSERYDKIKELNMDNGTFMRITHPRLTEKDCIRVKAYQQSGKNPIETTNRIKSLATKYNNTETKYVSTISCTIDPLKNIIWPKDYFEASSSIEFEGFYFQIPKKYEELLKLKYGNYMNFPPKEQRGSQHSHYFFDPDKPFQYYLDNPDEVL